jgi:hypothetical protein
MGGCTLGARKIREEAKASTDGDLQIRDVAQAVLYLRRARWSDSATMPQFTGVASPPSPCDEARWGVRAAESPDRLIARR